MNMGQRFAQSEGELLLAGLYFEDPCGPWFRRALADFCRYYTRYGRVLVVLGV